MKLSLRWLPSWVLHSLKVEGTAYQHPRPRREWRPKSKSRHSCSGSLRSCAKIYIHFTMGETRGKSCISDKMGVFSGVRRIYSILKTGQVPGISNPTTFLLASSPSAGPTVPTFAIVSKMSFSCSLLLTCVLGTNYRVDVRLSSDYRHA